MGLTALGPEVATSAEMTRLTATVSVGASVGSVFAAAGLVYALGYLNVLEAAEGDYPELWWTLVATSAALAIVFAATIVFTVGGVIIRPS